ALALFTFFNEHHDACEADRRRLCQVPRRFRSASCGRHRMPRASARVLARRPRSNTSARSRCPVSPGGTNSKAKAPFVPRESSFFLLVLLESRGDGRAETVHACELLARRRKIDRELVGALEPPVGNAYGHLDGVSVEFVVMVFCLLFRGELGFGHVRTVTRDPT